MKEQVIVQRVPVSRKGEIRQFQIKIPRSAERIVGIETGIMAMNINDQAIEAAYKNPSPKPIEDRSLFFSTLTFRPDLLIGELKLKSLEEADIFYATDVFENDLNFMFADYSIEPGFIPYAWTHSRKRTEDVVKVNGVTTVLQGIFKDRLGERLQKDVSYEVRVYVWYEVKDENENSDEHRICP